MKAMITVYDCRICGRTFDQTWRAASEATAHAIAHDKSARNVMRECPNQSDGDS